MLNNHRKNLLLLLCFYTTAICAQKYHYIQYNSNNGLAGSTVYGMVQDREGFMWFATETGVSRFDGIHFKNFDVSDGLPANEALGLTPDSQNRLWISFFSKEICYYKQGKIYNKNNDPLLQKIKIHSLVKGIWETPDLKIIILTQDTAITISGNTVQYNPATPATYNKWILMGGREKITNDSLPGNIKGWLNENRINAFHFIQKDKTSKLGIITTSTVIYLLKNKNNRLDAKKIPTYLNFYLLIDTNTIAAKKPSGFLLYDIVTEKLKYDFTLPCMVNEIFRDREGEFWFSTNGQGVFKLASPLFQSYQCVTKGINTPVVGIQKEKHIQVNDNNGGFWVYDRTKNVLTSKREIQVAEAFYNYTLTRPYTFIFKKFKNSNVALQSGSLKSAIRYNDRLLIATSYGVFFIQLPGLKITDTVFAGRSTCAYKKDNDIYIGTLNGLYKINKDNKKEYLGTMHKSLATQISFIALSNDGILWIATYDGCVVGIKDNRIIAVLNNLSGKTCLSLYAYNDHLWVGTEKGIDKIELVSGQYKKMAGYNISDGFPSNIINCIYEDSLNVYAGTPSGITIFKKDIITPSISLLSITGITVSGKEINTDQQQYLFPLRDNNIRFQFSGISFLSGNDMYYRYKLTGLDTIWQQTKESSLSYPSLPSGKYDMQIIAVNRFGKSSAPVSFKFEIEKGIWEELWVRLVIACLISLITAIVINARAQRIKRISDNKLNTERKIIELEQMALRAQMNPHFIFNSLNSIQNFIIKQDTRGANKYLTHFGALIRQTLENSANIYISLAEEVKYLTNYIELERLQMAGAFNYKIDTAGINELQITIPNMVVQPYVENAIKHGIGKTKTHAPLLSIVFAFKQNTLICTIEDNGPGINHNSESYNIKKYVSRGMDITTKRVDTINLINKNNKQPISVLVNDIFDDNTGATGTRVIINFPL